MASTSVGGDNERFKVVIHHTVGKICKDVEEETGVTFTKESIAMIADLTNRQAALFAKDLELFAKHGKRKRVNTDDVLLLTRKTPSLCKHLREGITES